MMMRRARRLGLSWVLKVLINRYLCAMQCHAEPVEA